MAALLARLERGRARARRGWFAAGGVALAIAGAAGLGWQQHARAQQVVACAAAGAEISRVWDDAARSQLAQALRLSGATHADATFAKVVPWVDRWTDEWTRVRAQVCEEATVAGTRPLAELASATACLEERRDELVQTLTVLGDGDRVSAARAVPVVAGLPTATACADPEVLARRAALPDDAGTRAAVDGLRRELMRVRGLRAAGRRAEGARRAESVLAAADALAYAPLTIEARLAFGGLVGEADPGRAEQALVRAYADAGAIGADELAATAATELTQLVGVTAARPAEGLVWGQSAAMFVARLGRAGALTAADVDLALAGIHTLRGAPAEALPLARRALEIREQALGADHPGVAAVRVALAGILRARGESAEAQAQLEQVAQRGEQALGPDSPLVAAALGDLAAVHLDRGAYEPALRLLERALPIQEAALGVDHPEVGSMLGDLGSVLLARGETSRAMGLLERSLHIQTQALGEGHPDVARSVHDLAVLRGRLGDHAEAVTLHRRALAARVAALGADHPEVLQSLDDLGHEHRAHDELAAAAEVDEQALALRERVLRAGHTVARAADERFRTAGARGAARSTAVRAWLGH
jgi:tetratricopeptide (TPR) repeat protein